MTEPKTYVQFIPEIPHGIDLGIRSVLEAMRNLMVVREGLTNNTDEVVLTQRKLNDLLAAKVYNPQVRSAGGALGAGASSVLRYVLLGRFAMVALQVTIPAAGTGNGALIVPLPFKAVTNSTLCGRSTTGHMLVGYVLNNELHIVRYDNTTAIISTHTMYLTGLLELEAL